jgi:hypothetical protein
MHEMRSLEQHIECGGGGGGCQLATTNISKTRSCNYSLEAPDDER